MFYPTTTILGQEACQMLGQLEEGLPHTGRYPNPTGKTWEADPEARHGPNQAAKWTSSQQPSRLPQPPRRQ